VGGGLGVEGWGWGEEGGGERNLDECLSIRCKTHIRLHKIQ